MALYGSDKLSYNGLHQMGQNPNQLEIDSMEMAEHVREVLTPNHD